MAPVKECSTIFQQCFSASAWINCRWTCSSSFCVCSSEEERECSFEEAVLSASLEASPLLRIQRHKAYLKYGSGPNLYKSGSMRAGPSLSNKNNPGSAAETRKNEKKTTNKFLNKNQVDRLYRSTSSKTGAKKPATKSASSNLVMTPEGKPLKAGNIRGKG